MPFKPKATAATAAAAALLILGIDTTTYAATGDSLLLGQLNRADRVTVIERTQPGPVLRLETGSDGSAPFSTNATGRVARLNADRVDGKDASALATRALTFRAGSRGQVVSPAGMWSTPVRPGLYEVTFNAMLWDLSATGPANFICGVLDTATFGSQNQTIYVASSAPYLGGMNGGPPAAVSGAATIRVRQGEAPGAVCFPETGTFQFFKPLSVTFTRINVQRKRVASPVALPRGTRLGKNPFGTD
jgi:hypothetical protein